MYRSTILLVRKISTQTTDNNGHRETMKAQNYLANTDINWWLTQTYCAFAFFDKLHKHASHVVYQLQRQNQK